MSQTALVQAQDFYELLNERDGLLNKFLSKQVSEENALRRAKTIHDELKLLGHQQTAKEANLYQGFILHFANKPAAAISVLKEGLVSIKPSNDTLAFKYLSLLGELYSRTANYDSAGVYFHKCHEYTLQKPELEELIPNEIIAFYNSFMYFLNLEGENNIRKRILLKAYALAKKRSNTAYKGYIENQLGVFWGKRNVEMAEKMFLSAKENLKTPIDRIQVNINLANLYIEENQWSKVESLIPQIRSEFSKILNNAKDFNVFKLKYQIIEAKWLFHQGKSEQAQKQLLNISSSAYRSRFDAQIQSTLALHSEGAEKIKFINRAISESLIDRNSKNLVMNNVLFPNELIKALSSKAILEKDIAIYGSTVRLMVAIKKAFPFEETVYSFDGISRPFIYEALKLSDERATFSFIESAKTGILNEVILNQELKYKNVSKDLLKKEKKLNHELTALRLTANIENDSISLIQEDIDNKRIELAFLKSKIEQTHPKYYQLKYSDDTVKVEEIQKTLHKNQLLINYFIYNSELFVSVLTNEAVANVQVKLGEDFSTSFQQLNSSISQNPGLSSFSAGNASETLYDYLVKPIEPFFANKTHLIIIRDAELNMIPFEILSPKAGDFLLDRFSISYDYTASLRRNAAGYKNNDNVLAFAPYANQDGITSPFRDRALGKLPFSNQEVESISGNTYKNQSATKSRFLEDYQKHGIIHFATHAQMDDIEPGNSFIAFYPDSSDYKLYTEELYNLSLKNTQLVVLSACEAGGGKLQKGEGLMSLARGFAYAGCPAVITTLWKANDESTAWLSERLHYYLGEGWNKADALRQAKLDFRASEIGRKYDHPYYWANFILIGDDSPLVLSFWSRYGKWLLLMTLLFTLFIAYKLRKRGLVSIS